MKNIKSFIYLDNYKMYSISSQIFEGLTEYIVNYSSNNRQDLEKQKGPSGSGKVLADIISQEIGTEERKFLYDYSYTLFEKKLLEDDKRVILIDSNKMNEIDFNQLENHSFIKVRGRMLFNDINIINNTIENFNKIGEALAYVTKFEEIKKKIEQSSQSAEQVSRKSKKGFSSINDEKNFNVAEFAKELGLHHDEEFLERLAFVLNYGYKDQFEIQIPLISEETSQTLFSASLKREYIKEDENLLIKKYSRYSEQEFVIFGMVTQSKKEVSELNIRDDSNVTEMKEALVNLTFRLSKIEATFVGKLSNEIIIDPIAVYREL